MSWSLSQVPYPVPPFFLFLKCHPGVNNLNACFMNHTAQLKASSGDTKAVPLARFTRQKTLAKVSPKNSKAREIIHPDSGALCFHMLSALDLCMCLNTSAYTYLYICVCDCVCIYIYMCVYLCIYIYVCMHACMYVCTYTTYYLYLYVFMSLCQYVCMYVSMYLCIYVCISMYKYV